MKGRRALSRRLGRVNHSGRLPNSREKRRESGRLLGHGGRFLGELRPPQLSLHAIDPATRIARVPIAPETPDTDRLANQIRHVLGSQAVAEVKLCVRPSGRTVSVELVGGSALPAFDQAVVRDALPWQFAAIPTRTRCRAARSWRSRIARTDEIAPDEARIVTARLRCLPFARRLARVISRRRYRWPRSSPSPVNDRAPSVASIVHRPAAVEGLSPSR